MAGSEYTLQLKAVLDSSQVQQELKRLQQSGGGGSGGGKSGGGNGYGAGIQRSLEKLDSSIRGLQRSIDALGRRFQTDARRFASAPYPRGASGSDMIGGQMAYAGSGAVVGQTKAIVSQMAMSGQSMLALEFMKFLRELRTKNRGARFADNEYLNHLNLLNGDYAQSSQQNLKNLQAMADEVEATVNKTTARRAAPARASGGGGTVSDTMQAYGGKKMAAFVGGWLGSSAGDVAEQLGYTRTSKVLHGFGSGLTAAGGAAWVASSLGYSSMATPVGVFAGLITAIAETVAGFKKLNTELEKAAKAQSESLQEAKRQATRLDDSAMYAQQVKLAERYSDFPNKSAAKTQRDLWKSLAESRAARLAEMDSPGAFAQRILAENEEKKKPVKYMALVPVPGGGSSTGGVQYRQMEAFRERTIEEKTAFDKAADEAIREYNKKYQVAKESADMAERTYQLWKRTFKSIDESLRSAERERSRRKNDSALRARLAREGAVEWRYTRRDEQAVDAATVEAYDILNQRYTPPQAKFETIRERLSQLRNRRNEQLRQAY